MNGGSRPRLAWPALVLGLVIPTLAPAPDARAHESRPASLELRETAPGRWDVLWRTPLLSGMRLPVTLVLLVVLLERSFRELEIRWPRWVAALPGYVVGSLGAFWTIQRTAILFGLVR